METWLVLPACGEDFMLKAVEAASGGADLMVEGCGTG